MKEQIKKKSQKIFEQIAFHNLLYDKLTAWDYFTVSPVRYPIFFFLNFIQMTCSVIIVSRKGIEIFMGYSIGIVDKYVNYDDYSSPNLLDIKINNLKKFAIETCIWVKIAKKVLFRNFL